MDTLTPAEVTALMLTMGEKKCKQPYYITFFKAWMAGWMVCFGAIVVQLVQGGSGTLRTSYPSLINLVASIFFPIGIIMLVLTGQELVTANFMMIPMTTLRGRTKIWELPVNWLIVFFGNLAGSLCTVAFLGHYSGLYNTDALITYSQNVAVAKTSLSWGAVVLRGIGCNFLVCMGVWFAAGARDTISKFVGLWFPVFVFVFLGFEHVVVNMYYIPIGMVNGADVSVGAYIGRSMIPSAIGNIIAALLLGVPMLLFYQPPELPLFNKLTGSQSGSESTIVRDEVDGGGGTLGNNLNVQPVEGKKH